MTTTTSPTQGAARRAASSGDSFDCAILEFTTAYAEQNERDYRALTAAVKSGRVTAGDSDA